MRIKNKTNILIVGMVLLASIILTLSSERIPAGEGLGYDGSVYGRMVREFAKFPHIPQLDNVYSRRIFPSGVVYCMLTVLNLPLSNINIIHAFQILNIILLVLVGYIWALIADELHISNWGKWLGLMGLFLNNAVLKFCFYYPVLTDRAALFFGILIFYFWLRDNKAGLIGAAFLSAFTWPTLIYQGLLLYIFPRKNIAWEKPRHCLNYPLALVTGFVFLAWSIYFTNSFTSGVQGGLDLLPENSSLKSCLILSVALGVLYLFTMIRSLFNNNYFFDIKKFLLDIRFLRLLVALVIYGITLALVGLFTTDKEIPFAGAGPIAHFLTRVFSASITRPFEFYIAHVFYFGPIFILAFWFLADLGKAAQSFGWGVLLVCLLNMVVTINPVSRTLTAFYPMVVVLTVLAVDKHIFADGFLKCFAIISILLSRVWLSYNRSSDWGVVYFNNYGAYMNNQYYFVQAASVVFLLFAGCLYLKRNNVERA